MNPGLTIGQAAAFAGVTVKTVRHYHKQRLLDEPRRDSSGYRRYRSDDLLRLVQIRTLAGAGVPLGRVRSMLDAEPHDLAAELIAVESGLDARIRELTERKKMLHRLTRGDQVLLTDQACALIAKMTELGFDAEFVAAQRESLILASVLAPELLDTYVTQLKQRIDDPAHVSLLRQAWHARNWSPDDPRLIEIAGAIANDLIAQRDHLRVPADFSARTDAAARYQLINHHLEEELPAIAKLTELVEQRLRDAGIRVPFT